MAKLNRERRLRERRAEKQAKKEARKLGLLDASGLASEELSGDEPDEVGTGEDVGDAVAEDAAEE